MRAPRRIPVSLLRLSRRLGVTIALGWVAGAVAPAEPAFAVVPPYAEEWSVPASPQDVEVDPFGRVWVSCSDDSIRVYTASGGQLLFAFGGTGSGDGEFSTPYGIAFDTSGDAYICDYAGARVEKFTSAGTFLFAWAIPSDRADHVAIDVAGDVYVTGYTDLSVHKYTPAGAPITDWPSDAGSRTSGIVEAAGDIHVVQWDAPNVQQFTTGGTFLGSFEAATIGGNDIEVDASDQLWIADYANHRVRIFTTSGVLVDDLGSFGSGPGEFNFAIAVAVGLDGSIYVGDELNSRIQRFGDPVVAVSPESADPLAGAPAIRSIAPNPCRTDALVTYTVPQAGDVRLFITDARGRLVAMLEDGRASAGTHQIGWAARDIHGRRLAAGVYSVHLAHAGREESRRLTIVK
jgi:streptogramin lyase